MSRGKCLKLNSNDLMPIVGFGAWKVAKNVCADTIYNAIKSGYRLIDGAQDYGNEKECGEGVRRAIADGLVKREDIFITTKLWNTYHAKEHVEEMLRFSLKEWGLDYFDLFLIHFPIPLKYVDPKVRYPPDWYTDPIARTTELEASPLIDTWAVLETCVDKGLCRNIGYANFNSGLVMESFTWAKKIKPSVLQIEHHPYLVQDQLTRFAQSKGLAITAYSSFGQISYVELDNPRVNKAVMLLENDVVLRIAKETKKTPAQVLLRWATQRNIAVIPKTSNPHRLAENLDCLSWDLSATQMKSLSRLDCNLRMNEPGTPETPLPIF